MGLNEAQLKELFSQNLKFYMASTGTSELVLSEETGISQSAINRLKNGTVGPTLHQTMLIAGFFKISIDKLITESKDAHTDTNANYIPILDSTLFLEKREKKIIGFSKADLPDGIGFKQDRSFTQSMLGKGSIIIVKKIEDAQIEEGSTLLYAYKKALQIGNYINGKIHPIDNLMIKIDASDLSIVGKVCLMEVNYIKDNTLIEKIIGSIGKIKLRKKIDMLLPITA